MHDSMRTRVLVITDAGAVAQLWLAGAQESATVEPAFEPRVSASEYCACLTEEFKSGAIVGWGCFSEDDELLGYLTASMSDASPEFVRPRYLYLLDLDVCSSARRRGIGSELVHAARRFAADNGLASIEVNWLSADARAGAFWRAQGFTQYLSRARSTVAGVAPQ